jgi:hypothetical protein
MVAKGHVVTGGSGPGGPVDWDDVEDKPASFPPSSHTHAQVDVTGLGTALGAKANAVHTHAVADTVGLQATLDAKSATGHTHAYADITGKPATFAPSAHGHAIADVAGLETELATLSGDVGTAQDLAEEAAQVFIWDPGTSAYILSPGARIYIGPGDPGTGVLWINVDPS